MENYRLYLLLPMLLIAFGCNSGKVSSQELAGKLTGKWIMNGVKSGGTTAQCNVCPGIEFKNNGSAVLFLPSKQTKDILWNVAGDTVKLQYVHDTSNLDPFGRKSYLMEFKSAEKFTSLTLTQTDNLKQSYLLSK